MSKMRESQRLHKYIFEQLDKELRKVPDNQVKVIDINVIKEDVDLKEITPLEKEIYPLTEGMQKLIKRFSIPEKFHFEKENKYTVYFTVTYDPHEPTLSVVMVK